MRLLIQKVLFLANNSLLQKKLAVIVKGESAKVSKTDTNLEMFNCAQCNCTNSPEKGLTQHMQMKHCHSVDHTTNHTNCHTKITVLGVAKVTSPGAT